MRFHIILGTLVALLCVSEYLQALPNMADLIGDIQQENISSNLEGNGHLKRTKRATPTSKAMSRRNEILKQMVQNILDRDENIETTDALDIAKEALATEMHRVQRAEGVEGHKSVFPYLNTNND